MFVLGTKKTVEDWFLYLEKKSRICLWTHYNEKHAKASGCQKTVANFYFTFKVINILWLCIKVCTRNIFSLLSNTNKVFTPLLSHVTRYSVKTSWVVWAERRRRDNKNYKFLSFALQSLFATRFEFAHFA